ncbi:unnamed protein product [Linum tenue]|uniref:Uncharacterized protein n=1 Tax=Linum tenue TaxID=586396 RepID=A0AAV0PQX2_9ROSI|nr:unnamed protein product [Linum tenue]
MIMFLEAQSKLQDLSFRFQTFGAREGIQSHVNKAAIGGSLGEP